MGEGSSKDGDRRGRQKGTPWRDAWDTSRQTKEAVRERGRGRLGVTRPGCRGDTQKLTHRRIGAGAEQAGGGQWGAVGKYGRGRGGERSSIIKGKGGDVSQCRANVDYHCITVLLLSQARRTSGPRLFSQSIRSPQPPPYASSPSIHTL